MMLNKLAKELFNEISKVPCINSHSHLFDEKTRLSQDVDALVFFQHPYPAADLVAAGMTSDVRDKAMIPGLPLAERWQIFEPYWKSIRLTGYSQCIIESFRDLLGFTELTSETVGPISEAIRQNSKPGFYKEILRDKCNIAISLMNMDDLVDVDRTLFVPLPRLNRFSMIPSRGQIDAIEKDYNVSIGSLEDHIQVIRKTCEQWKEAKVAGVKLSQSYHRRMDFLDREAADAARIFDSVLTGNYAGLESEEGRLLEDYLVFECCRAASDVDLAIQFHLGMRAGNYGGLEGSSPAPIVNLLRAFPQARFDFSHSGYPYLREGAVLAKTFTNVYLDMSWIHIISPIGTRYALKEWLRMVPYNKIIGFGDDLQYVETVYGHLKIARQNVAIVLAEMIQEGFISESIALDVAKALFYDNPAELYRLSDCLISKP
ncbi:amidohydrolase family protein [bacterium]|nr:amidohydrolase family protein [bacterium]